MYNTTKDSDYKAILSCGDFSASFMFGVESAFIKRLAKLKKEMSFYLFQKRKEIKIGLW